jgi:hypothetical protein
MARIGETKVKNLIWVENMYFLKGRAKAQAVSRWLPTTAVRVRARVWSCEICGEQNGAGADFLRVLRFPCGLGRSVLSLLEI